MSQFVDATIQVMDCCVTEQELRGVGERLKNESMTDEERQELQEVYRDCLRAIRMFAERSHDNGSS